MKNVNIIIPAYKAQDTIGRTIASILTQSIVNDIQVTIVNDCDGIGYSKVIKRYKDLVDIEEVVLKKNGGPGVARQIGTSKTNLPYITYIDADDTFHNPFAVELMLVQLLHNPKCVVSVGEFIEQRGKGKMEFINHTKDTIWMFGKMYKRSFLKKYQIQFNTTRSNEDTGFNMIVNLCTNDNEAVTYYDNTVYVWWFKEDSITRINNFEYTYNQSFIGYTENMMYAIQHVRHVQPFNTKVDSQAIRIMASLYMYWIRTKFRDARFIDQNFGWAKTYYNTIFKDIMNRIPQEHIVRIVSEKITEEAPTIRDILIDITFYQFLELLEKDVEEVNESEVVENGEQK
jgi:glycosyltransferase involved in cell wall biosynthesis